MFTGIVEGIGTLRARTGRPGARAGIETALGPLVLGESISVNGACLTVSRVAPSGFECDLTTETLASTTLGDVPIGTLLHLERALQIGGRLGGHLVSGHVDTVGVVSANERRADGHYFCVRCPETLARFLAEKGSVAVDGVSLTINSVSASNAAAVSFDVMLVPHTLATTRLGTANAGANVNIEVDLLARYVGRQLAAAGYTSLAETVGDEARLVEKLGAAGFL
jgi:riboflavin synthase